MGFIKNKKSVANNSEENDISENIKSNVILESNRATDMVNGRFNLFLDRPLKKINENHVICYLPITTDNKKSKSIESDA